MNYHSLYKTRMCRTFEAHASCPYGYKCQFAHGQWELEHWKRVHADYERTRRARRAGDRRRISRTTAGLVSGVLSSALDDVAADDGGCSFAPDDASEWSEGSDASEWSDRSAVSDASEGSATAAPRTYGLREWLTAGPTLVTLATLSAAVVS